MKTNTIKSTQEFKRIMGIDGNELADRSLDYIEETLESAGCTGQCPIYPGAPMSDDGMPDCSKCPEKNEE